MASFEILRIAALTFWRDRAGLVLAFVLPPLVFLVFAAVFGSGVSGKVDVKAVAYDRIASVESRQLLDAVNKRLDGRLTRVTSRAALDDALASSEADAGLVIAGDLRRDFAPVTVLADASKHTAGEVLSAQTQAAAQIALPRLMLDRAVVRLDPLVAFSDAQKAALATAPIELGAADGPDFVARSLVGAGGDPQVVYYAGGVSVLFLMFSAMQGAMAGIEERRSGIQQRLALSVGGVAPILIGRMAWLTGLGVAQSLAVFGLAAAVYHTPLLAQFWPWSATALATAASSAGLALALASACRTREQAQTVSTFAILILGAVGGSMAPRFLMPAAMQTLGWATPNAWAIDAYQSVLWRGVTDGRVFAAWGALAGFALAGLAAAWLIERRRQA